MLSERFWDYRSTQPTRAAIKKPSFEEKNSVLNKGYSHRSGGGVRL